MQLPLNSIFAYILQVTELYYQFYWPLILFPYIDPTI